MYRIAKQSLYLQLREQLFHTRPLLVLQRPVSQINVILPDRIRFFYPDADGHPKQQEINVCTLGENAHGVCFLTGIRPVAANHAENAAAVAGRSGVGVYTGDDIDCCAEAGPGIDYITGAKTGIAAGVMGAVKGRIKADQAATEAFRMDLIAGPITRLENGERMTLQDWERRVRRRYAMDCKTDALPLSSMLITVKSEIVATPD